MKTKKQQSTKKYNDLIRKARSENRVKDNGVYYEGHHIIPKCAGGKGSSNGWKTHPNIVLLTASEHFWAHVWLIDIYPEYEHKMRWALHRMMNSNNAATPRELDIESKKYEQLRKEHSEFISKSQTGRKLSTTTVEKIRKSAIDRDLSGENNPFYGKTHTPEMIEFYRESQKGEKSPLYGKQRDRESVEKGAKKLRGVPKSKEHREKLSISKMGQPSPNRKLTDGQVRSLRKLTCKEARKKYGISRGTYYRIKNGTYYKNVI